MAEIVSHAEKARILLIPERVNGFLIGLYSTFVWDGYLPSVAVQDTVKVVAQEAILISDKRGSDTKYLINDLGEQINDSLAWPGLSSGKNAW